MKSVTVAMAAHLGLDCTTLATLWEVSRLDGVTIYFTDHDQDIVFSTHTYAAVTGFTPSATEHKADLSPDNVDVTTFLDVSAISEADVRARKYDGAAIKIRLVNWADTSMGDVKIMAGTTGDVMMENGVAHVQIRSLAQKLTTQIGEVFGPQCRADLGDSRCGVSINVQAALVTIVTDAHTFTLATGLYQRALSSDVGTTAAPTGWFNDGIITFTSGLNDSLVREIKSSTKNMDGSVTIVLRESLPYTLAGGDTANIEPGCNKKRGAGGCLKFSNIVNFRGEPDIPGSDAVLDYPTAPK